MAHLTLHFFIQKITSTQVLHRLTPFIGNLATLLQKNYQPADRFREENVGKLGKMGCFGHIENHNMHIEHLKNRIPEMAYYHPRTQNPYDGT